VRFFLEHDQQNSWSLVVGHNASRSGLGAELHYRMLVDVGSHSLQLPQGDLKRDAAGNIFGTTWFGGSGNVGTV
jgi:hypothetical protein